MNCIGCGNTSLFLYSQDSYLNLPIYHCCECNLFITGNSETQLKLTLKNYYEQGIITKDVEKIIKYDFESRVGIYLKNLWKSHNTYCKPCYQKSKNLLEIGPGPGLALRMFEEAGFNVTGIESNESYVKFINKKLKNGRCILGFAEDIHIEQKFDIIWLSHCLEHMIRPDLLLKKCKDLLNDDGFIFIAVPDCENVNTLKASIYDNASSFHFSKKALMTISSNAGFIVERCDSVKELSRIERRFNIILRRIGYLNFVSKRICPYYPFKITYKADGIEIRIVLRKK